MAIAELDVVVGGIYATASNQERRVKKIVNGKIEYESRGGNVRSAWGFGSPKSALPTLKKFAEDCDRVISKPAKAEGLKIKRAAPKPKSKKTKTRK